jgi:formate/nitrite transporter FocA (FNT family)
MSDEPKQDSGDDEAKKDKEAQEVEDRASPASSIVYRAVRKEGEDELDRATSALAWSGIAAGLSMGFSFITQALLRSHLPDEPWRVLIATFGYSIGFLIVVLGRQQLFTENTLTVILPLLTKRDGDTMRNVARLWTVVLLANLLGAWLFAGTISRTHAFDPGVHESLRHIADESLRAGFATTLLRGVFAGWLIALMVWLMPFAEAARPWIIIIVTYVVGLGGFSHVIVGSVEAMYLAFEHQIDWVYAFTGLIVPALIGNVIGGVALVAAINHAQVVAGSDGVDS